MWAPNALEVQVAGEWAGWDGAAHPMSRVDGSGVWSAHVPGAGIGPQYKYRIRGADGAGPTRRTRWRATRRNRPAPPRSCGIRLHVERRRVAGGAPTVSRSPRPCRSTRCTSRRGASTSGGIYSWHEIADALVPYVQDLGFTHVELMPVMQHPFGGSWGYHVTSYFAPDSRFGDPDGLKLLIDRLHQAGVGVILDWVPGHFATDPWALARFDGTALYEDPNPQRGWHKEWGSHIFNFGRHEVRNFLYANALYWLEEFHADGLRVDGVASMLYLDYAREHGEWSPTSTAAGRTSRPCSSSRR